MYYYDTGLLVKLYTPEAESIPVQQFVQSIDLARAHAAATGCRTLDTLHVACAQELGFRDFVTSDRRQAALAERLGFTVHNPAVL